MKILSYTAITIIIICTIGSVQAYKINRDTGSIDTCSIITVDDWDTFSLSCRGNILYPNVRLLWVNTPDTYPSIWRSACYYSESKKYMVDRIGRSYDVIFFGSDLCKDPYKGCRHLVQLFDREYGIDLWAQIIRKWIWFSWTNFSNIPNNIKFEYDNLERDAYNRWLWLWSTCDVDFLDDSQIDSPIPDKMTS